MHEFFYARFGMFIYSIPAALILFIGREWYLFSVMSKMGVFMESHYRGKTKNPLLTFDLWAFVVFIFGGFSWGGLVNREKRDTAMSFILAQLWFFIIIAIAFVFLHSKGLSKSSYMYVFLIEIMKKSWLLLLVNFLPVPPFDGSFFYAQKNSMKNVVFISKVAATAVILFVPVHNDFLSGQSLIKVLGLY